MSQVVADRYAEALFAIATEKSLVDRIDGDLKVVVQAISESRELRGILEHPLVSRKDKKEIATKLFAAHVDGITMNFLGLLFDRNRGHVLPLIQARFQVLADRLARRVKVQVRTAVAVAPEDLQALRERLEKAWERSVELDPAVDPSLIGGVRMRVDDQVIDGSILGRLEALKKAMMA